MSWQRRIYGLYLRVGALAVRSGLNERLGGRASRLADYVDTAVRGILYARPPREATLRGMTLRFPPEGYFGIEITSGTYERWTTETFLRLLRDDTRFVDVGAHVGYYTVLAGRHLQKRAEPDAVFAFEPDAVSFGYLEQNVRANGCGHVVKTVHAAVSDHVGRATLFAARRDRLTNSIFPTPGVTRRGTEIDATTLDRFFADRGWPRVDLVKVDVEGAEHAVLRGMAELSARNPDLKLLIEFFPRNLAAVGVTPARFFATLAEIGLGRVSMILEELVPLDPSNAAEVAARQAGDAFVNLLCVRA